LPHAVGVARAMQLASDGAVVLAFQGDGATSAPDFHAALNFAGLWRAPDEFVFQNNGYASSVPSSRQTASDGFAITARAYGFDGETVDGNDALAVFSAVGAAVARARRGQGPTLLECLTYRVGPHSTSDDPTRYRPAGEAEAWAARDPISILERQLRDCGAVDADLAGRLRTEVDAELDRAISAAEAAPAPPLSSLFDDVYAQRPWHLGEQAERAGASQRKF
jgi:pyruvate dehydrogenase E1 component alpha subunit/2-oxoisovalerate dehydrogenase E1 component alpha subunit